jgi:hypothetical protein
MAYNKKQLFGQAMEVIKDKKLFFIEDVVSMLPCNKATFYKHFPVESEEYNALKDEMERNKVAIKASMRNKWYNSSNPTLQVCLMKLICTDEERKRISNTYVEGSVDITTESQVFKIGDQTIKFS